LECHLSAPIAVSRRGQATERRHLTVEQYARLRDATPDRYRLAMVLMAYCGLRWGEMAGLRLRNIDRDRRLVHVVETVTEVGGKLAPDTQILSWHAYQFRCRNRRTKALTMGIRRLVRSDCGDSAT
jgi:integrase